MVIDSSALLAIVYVEPEARKFIDSITADEHCLVSAATLLEIGINLINRSETAFEEFERFVDRAGIQIVPVDEEQARIAIDAARFFGKGRHPAGLNYGDCFSYALSKQTGEPLLFKGNDFAKTDVVRVL
ncbi:MAG TPA: type II toxin-antitoxin system VapC family toxin [Acidobacteriaceae bacterium]